MAHQLCMRGQYSYTLHCMLHSREGHSVPIKKVQKPKIKAITLFFFFVIASIRLRCERCPTVQEEYVSSKRKSKIVHSNLQVTEEKNKKERKEPWMWCFCVQKRKRWPSCLSTSFFPTLRNSSSPKTLTPIPIYSASHNTKPKIINKWSGSIT